MRNIKLTLEYDGSAFFGYQFQPHVPTIQGALEESFKRITKCPARAVGAGRTDTGVHAVGQVVLFKTDSMIPCDRLVQSMNARLGGAVVITSCEETEDDFHPCFSAKLKHYRYLFKFVDKPSPFLRNYFWQVTEIFDLKKIEALLPVFIGNLDYAAFAKSPQQYETTFREVTEVSFNIKDGTGFFDVWGKGFMHNMVRNMAKAVYLVGCGELLPTDVEALFRSRDRRVLGAPASPGGLYMMQVIY